MKRMLSAVLIMTALHTAAGSEPGAAESKSAHVDGLKIHYTNYGQGPMAVVFVHGWTCDESVWEGQGTALVAQNIRAITIDLPGHGQSDKPQIAYTPDLSARAIAAVLDHAEVKASVLVGHSLGTAAIRQTYRHSPGRVAALVVVDGALRPFGDAGDVGEVHRSAPRSELRAGNGAIDRWHDAAGHRSARAPADQSEHGRSPQHVAVSAMEATADPALWKPDRIDVPVLMIMARNPRWNGDYEQFVHSFIPTLDYQVWDDVSHFLMMEKPREFTESLVAFMRKHLLLPERS
jgi:pimeloyl-ACP methyl ester carboxylesterase